MFPGREEPASPGNPIKCSSFATTHWSVVLATRDSEPDRARQALERLCATYWYPIYACIRRSGKTHDQAEDLTQGFFERLLSHQAFQRLEPTKGRVRAFLRVALQRYLQETHEADHRWKRAGGKTHIHLDGLSAEARYRYEPVEPSTPEQLFERRWAMTLLDTALQRLKTESAQAGHASLFEQLKGAILGDSSSRPYAEIGESLQMSAGAVRLAVMRLRRRFARCCREEVAHTVDDPAEIESELNYLLRVLGE
jgi:RNA polymerase sigma factor (sigma-70 family)